MLNTQKLTKVAIAWTSITYAICFVGVALFFPVRPGFMKYVLHMNMGGVQFQNVMTFGTFFSGLIIWNILAILGVWLFAALWNRIK